MKKQVKKIGNSSYEFSIQTLGSKIQKQSLVTQKSRGLLSLLTLSTDQESKDAADLLDKLATLEVNVQRLDKEGNPEYEFSFFDLELTDENLQLVEKVYSEYVKWHDSFRGSGPKSEE